MLVLLALCQGVAADVNDIRALHPQHQRRRFERAAASFDSADFVHRLTREGLFSRLQPVVVDAGTVLDLGSATGGAGRQLRGRFRRAHIVSLDVSRNMLCRSRTKRAWYETLLARPQSFVQADAARLPLADDSVDFVFCNLLLPFVDNPDGVLSEVGRVLRGGGVFAFATLGPDSLLEIRRAWGAVDDDAHVNHFLDMHDVGDALLRAGLRDPVLDVDPLTVRYESAEKLFADLTSVGARNALRARRPALTGRRRYDAMLAALQGQNDGAIIELRLELVYGHCFGGSARKDPSNFAIDATNIPLRRG